MCVYCIVSTGKLHRNLRLNVEHIPDSKLCDIQEEDVTTDASREVLRDSHDGLTSDDTDLEPSGESRCVHLLGVKFLIQALIVFMLFFHSNTITTTLNPFTTVYAKCTIELETCRPPHR